MNAEGGNSIPFFKKEGEIGENTLGAGHGKASAMKFPFHPQFQQAQKEVEALLSKDPYMVGDFVDKEEYKKYQKQGIYVFTDPEDKEIVYIGKSISHWRGVGGRARHHERPWRSLQKKLEVDPESFRNYHVRVHEIEDPLIRGTSELYGIAVYVPLGNRIALVTECKPDFDQVDQITAVKGRDRILECWSRKS
jgi:hypothetical protein